MKKYTEEEVEFLLKEQRENCAFSIGLSSRTLIYPQDYDKIADIIKNSPLVPSYEQALKKFYAQSESQSVRHQKQSKEVCDHPLDKRASFKSHGKDFCWRCGKHIEQTG